jgi:hypothetical protein
MSASSVQVPQIVLVLCHSFFHDAFCVERPVDSKKFKLWLSSRFIANLIIERQAELPEGSSFAVTAKQVFDNFAYKFHGNKPSFRQREVVDILRNSILVIEAPSITKLSIDDAVLVICDTLYSRSSYTPILLTNIPAKLERAEDFYRKKDPKAKIPYPISSTVEAEPYLRSIFPELSRTVDTRMKNSVYKF